MSDTQWLVTREIPHLRRFARALVYNADQADDLVQDTLERALRKMHLWQRDGSLRSWLMKMQFRVYLNGKQGGRYTPAGADDTDVLLAQASAHAPADVRLACKQALAGIATLPDEQRGAMLLVALEGLSYDQAAHVLDIPIGTLRSRLSRAREALRQYMDGQVTSTPPLRRVK